MSKSFVKIGSNGNGSNGSAAQAAKTDNALIEEAVVVEEKQAEAAHAPVPVPVPEPVVKKVPEMTLDQKLEKVEELNRIIAKYQKLQEARKNLNTFKIGSDGLNLTITIRDATGQEFKTSHNVVVQTVLDSVRQILNEKIKEVEKDITFNV